MSLLIRFIFFINLLLVGIRGQGQTLAEKASGLPQLGLPRENYEQITAFRLKGAKILWYNNDLLKELGFKIEKF